MNTVKIEASSDPEYPIRIVLLLPNEQIKDIFEVKSITAKYVRKMEEHVK
jgi:hypothetical protein